MTQCSLVGSQHGKPHPWNFIVISVAALDQYASQRQGVTRHPGLVNVMPSRRSFLGRSLGSGHTNYGKLRWKIKRLLVPHMYGTGLS